MNSQKSPAKPRRIREVITNAGVVGNQLTTRTIILTEREEFFELRQRTVDKNNKTEIELYWFQLPSLPEEVKNEPT